MLSFSDIRKAMLPCLLLFAAGVAAFAQAPKFEDYRVAETFSGKPAPPKIVRPADREFRTRIREDAAKGPNFAGHYTIATWGCGGGCVSFALVDAKSGTVYPAPFKVLAFGVEVARPLEYKLNSSLLVVQGCPEEDNCGSYFYTWTGSEFKLVRKAVGPQR
jgi:hypothetical protein